MTGRLVGPCSLQDRPSWAVLARPSPARLAAGEQPAARCCAGGRRAGSLEGHAPLPARSSPCIRVVPVTSLTCSLGGSGSLQARSPPFNILSLPNEITSLPTKCTLPTFSLFAQTPPFFAQTTPFLSSLLRSQGLWQLHRSRAAETHWFRWKEIDVMFTIAVTLLERRTQPTADNYLGRQSLTGEGPIYFNRPFQVPDTLTARGQHSPAARQSRVRIPATDSFRAETRNTSFKLCWESDCTICSAKHIDTD